MEDDSFSINKYIDNEINITFHLRNYAKIFLPFPLLSLSDYFSHRIKNTTNLLLEAIKYEYGINRSVNFQSALEHYTLASEKNNPYALYKLYLIDRDHSQRTNFNKKNDRNFGIFNLLKAYAYSDFSRIRFRLYHADYDLSFESEISLYLRLHDSELDKTNKLFLEIGHLVDETELRFTEAITLIKFYVTDDDRDLGISVLQDLSENVQYLHAIWKLACLYFEEKKFDMAGKYFQILLDKKFYESYYDCVAFEIDISTNIDDRRNYFREILSQAIIRGYHQGFSLYFRLSLCDMDITKVNQFLNENINFLLNDIVAGNIFTLLEYFMIIKRVKKSIGIKEIDDYSKYFFEIILSNLLENYEKLSTSDSLHFKIFVYFSMGFINFWIYKNNKKAEELFKKSYDLLLASNENYSKSYLRICYFYIFKTRSKLYPLSHKLDKTKLKLFKIFIEELPQLSCESFTNSGFDFYCLGKIFENGWGTEINELKSFSFYHKSSESTTLDFSFLSFYKRKKSKEKKLNQAKFLNISKEILNYKNSIISNFDENSLCNICFDINMEIIFLTCKHMTCKECFNKKFEIEKKCPICRTKIISIL